MPARQRQQHRPLAPGTLRRAAGLFADQRLALAGLLGIVVVEASLGVGSPFLVRALLDDAIPSRDIPLISLLAILMIAASIMSGLLDILSTGLATRIGQHVMHEVRTATFAHLQSLSLRFYSSTKSGELLSRMLNDISGVEQVVVSTLAGLVGNVTTLTFVAVGVLVLDWRLAIIGLIIVPLYLLFTFRLNRRRRTVVRGRADELAGMTSLIGESLSVRGMILARTSGAEPALRERFAGHSSALAGLEIRTALLGRWSSSISRSAFTLIPAISYWIAGLAIAQGISGASLGSVVAFASMLNRMVRPASGLSNAGGSIAAGGALFERIFAALDLPLDVVPGSHELPTGPGRVRFDHVTVTHDGADAPSIEDIDLTLEPGTVTALVGATGSGKTTLAYLASRLLDPTGGRVEINGMDLREATTASIADRVGVVSQDTFLLHASIRENLLLVAPDATEEQLAEALHQARLEKLVAGLPDGLDTLVGEQGHRFSGGERQRLAIARVLLRTPPILVLDEATSALDVTTERAVLASLATLGGKPTMLVIAHRLASIRNADQIVVLEHGRIVECGTHEELRAAGGAYAAMTAANSATGATSKSRAGSVRG